MEAAMPKSIARMREFRIALLLALGLALVSVGGAVVAATYITQ
jgi:hypothetical protein